MNAIPISITAVFAGLLALMLVGISIQVTLLRARKKINLFDGGDEELGRAIRVQGNFVEYVPMALALMALIEWTGAGPWLVYAIGIALLVARILHAVGLYASAFKARAVGTSLTWVVMAAAALILLGRIA
ncbi:MAG: hypothetical protein EXR32_00645 [Betaproteobacteria bacterium]|nr:hypothetical protein [Betaproteobacteria bacterium]